MMVSTIPSSRSAGVLYLVTFLTSIPALILKSPVLHDPDFVLGAGSHGGVLWAGFLDVLLAIARIGTAVVLYPVARRQARPPPWALSVRDCSRPRSSSSARSACCRS